VCAGTAFTLRVSATAIAASTSTAPITANMVLQEAGKWPIAPVYQKRFTLSDCAP
jgi:hypothetical protein